MIYAKRAVTGPPNGLIRYPRLVLCGVTLDRDPPFFLSNTINAHYNGSLCVFCIFQNNSPTPNMRVAGRVSGRRARDRGLNCPSWHVEGFRIGVSQGDLSGRGRAVGLRSRPLDLRSRPLCAEPRLRELCITQAMEDGVGGVYKRCTRLSDDRCSHSRRRLRLWLQRSSLSWSLGP